MKRKLLFLFTLVFFISNILGVQFVFAAEEENYEAAKAALLSGIGSRSTVINISSFDIPESLAEQLFFDALFSAPAIAYINMDFNNDFYSVRSGIIQNYNITYLYNLTESYIISQRIADKFAGVKGDIYVEGMHLVDKLLAAHEYIAIHTDKAAGFSTVYDALVLGMADSRGYALLFKMFADDLGIASMLVAGNGKYWNIVEINGNWYNVDVYDNDIEDNGVLGGDGSHMYFLVSDDMLTFFSHDVGTAFCYGAKPNVDGGSIRIRIWDNVTSRMFYRDGYWHYLSQSNLNLIVKRLTSCPMDYTAEITVYDNNTYLSSLSATSAGFYYISSNTLYYLAFNDNIPFAAYNAAADSLTLKGSFYRDGKVVYETLDSSASYARGVLPVEGVVPRRVETVNSVIYDLDIGAAASDILKALVYYETITKYDADKAFFDSYEIATGTKLILTSGNSYSLSFKGDVNGDRSIDITDAMYMISIIFGAGQGDELRECNIRAAMYAGGDNVTVNDLNLFVNDLYRLS